MKMLRQIWGEYKNDLIEKGSSEFPFNNDYLKRIDAILSYENQELKDRLKSLIVELENEFDVKINTIYIDKQSDDSDYIFLVETFE